MENFKNLGFATRAIRAGEIPDVTSGSGDVVKAIHLSTTFAREKVDLPSKGFEYIRTSNPTRKSLEEKLASLENAKYGLTFSSGLAAETTVLLSLLNPGDHVIAFDDLYGGTKRLFNNVFLPYKFETSYVDATVASNVEKAIKPNTKLVWVETPSNPLLKVCDIKAISEITKKHNIIFLVDNTFLSPYFQKPIDLGADIVVHSCTKYLGGHSDVLAGAVLVNDETLYNKIKFNQNAIGAVLPPFDSYLVIRGIKTLELRMQKHNKNALEIAEFLESHPKIKKVYYPGLKSHPQHAVAQKQSTGFGGVISIEIKGDLNDAKNFLERLTLFSIAESLGGVESLIGLPALMSHSSVPKELRLESGIGDTFIRISVGIEDSRDLISDLKQALNPS